MISLQLSLISWISFLVSKTLSVLTLNLSLKLSFNSAKVPLTSLISASTSELIVSFSLASLLNSAKAPSTFLISANTSELIASFSLVSLLNSAKAPSTFLIKIVNSSLVSNWSLEIVLLTSEICCRSSVTFSELLLSTMFSKSLLVSSKCSLVIEKSSCISVNCVLSTIDWFFKLLPKFSWNLFS